MPRRRPNRARSGRRERGQASLMTLGVVGAVLAGALVLFAFGNALGAKGRHQRAADLAAISAAQVMRELYPRLFEPPLIEPDVPNPRHLDEAEYRERAVAAAVRGAKRNGVHLRASDVGFGGSGFAPAHVTVRIRSQKRVKLEGVRRIPIRARATAELLPDAGDGLPGHASGEGYSGPLAYRQGKPMRPDVALAFDRMAAAAREEGGLFISVTSGFRSDAEQAALFAAHPDPKWVAPPGESLHRYATELDLGPPNALCLARRQRGSLRLHKEVQLGSVALRVAISPQIDLPPARQSIHCHEAASAESVAITRESSTRC